MPSMTTAQLEALAAELEDGGFDDMKAVAVYADDLSGAIQAIRELIRVRDEIGKIAANCADKDTAHKLSELFGGNE